jgi:glycosyltransferase involved in cell wall biosynthesis
MQPLISVITPVYNSEKFLKSAIKSVINQTYKNWELIIINDNSNDDSHKIIKKYKSKKIKYFVNPKTFGAGYSRNVGTRIAKGRYITFIDSDDIWHKNYLLKTYNFLKKNNYDFVFTSYFWMNEDGFKKGIFQVPKKIDYKTILKSNPISCLTRMYDTKYIGKIYSPKLKIRQDYVFCLKILKRIKFAYGLNDPLAYRRLRSSSLSNNKIRSAIYQFYVYYKIENFNLFKSFYYLFFWFILGIIKHFRNYGV